MLRNMKRSVTAWVMGGALLCVAPTAFAQDLPDAPPEPADAIEHTPDAVPEPEPGQTPASKRDKRRNRQANRRTVPAREVAADAAPANVDEGTAPAEAPTTAPAVDASQTVPEQPAGPPSVSDTQTGGDPTAPEPPPPPDQPGDFAGHGPNGGATQDDFAEAEMEYHHRERREFSVRIDPLNWLLLGRLRVELEATLWKFISLELVPVFVTARSPIALNYAGLDDPLTQHSNGIGPLSGASVGAGFWLAGEPFHGYVIRLSFSNYGYLYRSVDDLGMIDRVVFTERRVLGFFGSHSRFGPFTFAGGFGLGYELHRVERCGLTNVSNSDGSTSIGGRDGDCHGKQLIALDRNIAERADLNGPLHPVYFEARFSVGVVF